ncbi:MAG: hypothetical protein ACRDYX_22250 [Egibacteraceae bacterium]
MSDTASVTEWCAQYFGDWWRSQDAEPDARGTSSVDDRLVLARVDDRRYASIQDQVQHASHEMFEFAKAAVRAARKPDGSVEAVNEAERIAYRVDPASGHITLIGCGQEALNLAAARLVREAARAVLQRDGWTILHASAVVRGDRCLLMLGDKGSGKTTTALLLAKRAGWSLLANDRVFVRPDEAGIDVLPWPAAAAIGLGLLHALGLLGVVQQRLWRGQRLHPTQHPRVTAALGAGDRQPLWDDRGHELKAQVFPHQLVDWLGLRLERTGRATTLLFPLLDPAARPALRPAARTVCGTDFFSSDEERYPDFLQLALSCPALCEHARQRTRARLAQLPSRSIVLSHDSDRNARLLETLGSTGE